MTGRETLIAASRMSLAEATTRLRISTSATERRILSIRCHEPEAFAEICESAGIAPIGPPVRELETRPPQPGERPRPVEAAMLEQFLGRWNTYEAVSSTLGQTRKQVSRRVMCIGQAGRYRVERRAGARGLEHRIVAVAES